MRVMLPQPGVWVMLTRLVISKGQYSQSLLSAGSEEGGSQLYQNGQRPDVNAAIPNAVLTFRYITGLELEERACRQAV